MSGNSKKNEEKRRSLLTIVHFSPIMEKTMFAESERHMEDGNMYQKDKIGIGVIGVGARGRGIVKTVLGIDHACVTSICDVYEDRVERSCAEAAELQGFAPKGTTDWHELLTDADVDAILVLCAWEPHIEMAVAAMRAGKPVGVEVGGAYSLDDCWRLVRTYEETGTPCMLLENCCYGRKELMVANMVKQGLFGDIVHCEGGYRHDLRSEIAFGKENRHYRLRNYLSRNCENYPTHELGPIAQLLDINRGNRMVYLTSMSSAALGMHEFIRNHPDADQSLLNKPFAQGDVVTTCIKCARGETITLTLDTTLPRAYSRQYTVQGTRGMYMEDNNSVYLDRDHAESMHFNWKPQWDNTKEYLKEYEHPIWVKFLNDGVRGGHGGMDYLVYNEFVQAVYAGTPMPIDVYDMAAWMCISTLSEESIAKGSAPVAIPDFTCGRWLLHNAD